MDLNAAVAGKAGLSQEKIEAALGIRESSGLSERERIALEYADRVSATPVDVPDEFSATLHRLFSEREIVELTAYIAHENFNTKSARPLRVDANYFCAVPFHTQERRFSYDPWRRERGSLTMRRSVTIALLLVGLTGLTQIVLGALFWTGHSLTLIPLHMQVGFLFVISLWALTALAARAGASPSLAALTVLWGAVVAAVGFLHDRLLPGAGPWVIKTLHLLIGLAALGLSRTLVASIAPARAPSVESSKRGADKK